MNRVLSIFLTQLGEAKLYRVYQFKCLLILRPYDREKTLVDSKIFFFKYWEKYIKYFLLNFLHLNLTKRE